MKPRPTEHEILEACRGRLRSLRAVKRTYLKNTERARRSRPDGELVIETDVGPLHYIYEVKKGLTPSGLEHLLLRRDPSPRRLLLLSDYLNPRLRQRLLGAGFNFVDTSGNVYLDWRGKFHVQLEGGNRKDWPEAAVDRIFQPRGLQVLYVLLSDPAPTSLTYRELAKRSGVSLGTLSRVINQLKVKGHLQQRRRNQWVLTRRQQLMDQWVAGYEGRLRPNLLLGRYRPPEVQLDHVVRRFRQEAQRRSPSWVLTGGFAADLLVHHFRGDQLVIFVDRWPLNFIESMKWLPETRGLVTILRQFSGEIVFRERAHLKSPIAHPLLIYAELLFQGQERALETARMVYDRYLIPLLRE